MGRPLHLIEKHYYLWTFVSQIGWGRLVLNYDVVGATQPADPEWASRRQDGYRDFERTVRSVRETLTGQRRLQFCFAGA